MPVVGVSPYTSNLLQLQVIGSGC